MLFETLLLTSRYISRISTHGHIVDNTRANAIVLHPFIDAWAPFKQGKERGVQSIKYRHQLDTAIIPLSKRGKGF